jgi:hypothetical protein
MRLGRKGRGRHGGSLRRRHQEPRLFFDGGADRVVEPALAHVPGDVLQPLADRGRVGQGLSSRRGERRRFDGCSKRRRGAGPDGAFEARHRLQQLRGLRRAAAAVIFDQEPAVAPGFHHRRLDRVVIGGVQPGRRLVGQGSASRDHRRV